MKERMKELLPKDHGEAVAQYRSEIVGALTKRDLDHGELGRELEELSKKRFRAPRSRTPRPRVRSRCTRSRTKR